MKPVLVTRLIRYECGCNAEYPVLANPEFALLNNWNITPCVKHKREEVEKRVENDWKLIHNGKL